MSGWIKLWKDLVNDPRILSGAARLGGFYTIGLKTPGGSTELSPGDASRFGRAVLLGALVTLWEYADTFIGDDDRLPIDAHGVDALVGIQGFCELIPDHWLLEFDDGTVQLPGYCLKNQLVARRKRAANGKDRTARWRSRNAKGDAAVHHRDPTVTRHAAVSQGADPDQDLDQDPKRRGGGLPPPLVLAAGRPDQSAEPKPHASLPTLAWTKWLEYRRKRKWPMDAVTLGIHLKLLSAHPPEIQTAIIERSIGSGWQGLFEPRGGAKPTHKAAPTTAELEALGGRPWK